RSGGALGTDGSVAWMFKRVGEVQLAGGADEDEALLAAADAGAEDIASEDGVVVVTCEPGAIAPVRAALEESGFEVERSESVLRPTNTIELDEESLGKVVRLIDSLED